MSQMISIKDRSGESVGAIRFDETGERLMVRRTANGFTMTLPADVSLRLVAKGKPVPMVSRLWGVIFAAEQAPNNIEIGQVRDEQCYSSSYWLQQPGGETSTQAILTWRGTFSDLVVYEKVRAGKPPKFYIQLWGEICYLFSPESAGHRYRSEPVSFYGDVHITYPKEQWVSRLQGLGLLQNILVEVPLPNSPPAPWDEVWQSLISARNAFEQGGSTGWKGCVGEIRVALEKWRVIEPEDVSQNNPRARTKQQRLDHLRWHLHSCAHHWVHNPAENCSRDDALLMLSTFSALLAERKP